MCRCGQEVYSAAIYLDEAIKDDKRNIRYRIFATDIDDLSLKKARAGVYDKKDVQNIQLKYLSDYFEQDREAYIINSELKKHIDFSYYHMLSRASMNPPESIYGDFDIVFCCNLLLYYTPENRLFIIDKLVRSLSPKGFLIFGRAEKGIAEKVLEMHSLSISLPIFNNLSKQL